MSSKRPPNYVAKKLYFDWQQLETYRMMAEFIGSDIETLMYTCIAQGMGQLDAQIAAMVEEKDKQSRESIPEKTPEQVQATKDTMFPEGGRDAPTD